MMDAYYIPRLFFCSRLQRDRQHFSALVDRLKDYPSTHTRQRAKRVNHQVYTLEEGQLRAKTSATISSPHGPHPNPPEKKNKIEGKKRLLRNIWTWELIHRTVLFARHWLWTPLNSNYKTEAKKEEEEWWNKQDSYSTHITKDSLVSLAISYISTNMFKVGRQQ